MKREGLTMVLLPLSAATDPAPTGLMVPSLAGLDVLSPKIPEAESAGVRVRVTLLVCVLDVGLLASGIGSAFDEFISELAETWSKRD